MAGLLAHDVLLNVGYHMLQSTTTYFDLEIVSCKPRSTLAWLPWFLGLYNIVVPIAATVLANTVTVAAILRTLMLKPNSTRPYKKATITILTISIAFLISYVPYFVEIITPDLPVWYRLSSMYILSVNIVLNPFIYAIVDREFITYIKLGFINMLCAILECCEVCYEKMYGGGFEEEETTNYSFELIQVRR